MSAKRSISLEAAKSKYVNRFTCEHVPSWALYPAKDGLFYAPQYSTDQEWYDRTTFPGEGSLPKNSLWCESNNQTFPLGKFLKQRYVKA